MLAQMLVASAAVFLIVLGWVCVNALRRNTMENDPECQVDRHECGHCLMMSHCAEREEE